MSDENYKFHKTHHLCLKRPSIFFHKGMRQCFYKGVFYNQGSTFPQGDGCNTCICNLGALVTCTDVDCPPPVETCQHGTRILMVDETFILETQFLCYNCTCTLGGRVTCLPLDCPVLSTTERTTSTPTTTTTATTTRGRYFQMSDSITQVNFSMLKIHQQTSY